MLSGILLSDIIQCDSVMRGIIEVMLSDIMLNHYVKPFHYLGCWIQIDVYGPTISTISVWIFRRDLCLSHLCPWIECLSTRHSLQRHSLKKNSVASYYDRHDNRKTDATIWSSTLQSSIMPLEASFTLLEPSCMMLIVKASLIFITHGCNMFIVKVTGCIQKTSISS